MLMNDLIELILHSHHAIWNLSPMEECPAKCMQSHLILLGTANER